MKESFLDNQEIVKNLNRIGVKYCDMMKYSRIAYLLADVDFLCKIIQEEQELIDDEDDGIVPIIQVVQDDSDLRKIQVILLGSSFVFTDKDYTNFLAAISHSNEMIIKKSGKNGVKIILRFVL